VTLYPSLASSVGRFPKNCLQGSFLDGNPPHRFESLLLETKTPPASQARRGSEITGGELGIRTLDALVGHTHLAGEHLRPLGQLSEK
jgi:hypothetical protein